ncbi:MAG: hypothetical protein K6E40_13295, partial [Desulfovibrio sp.]|nr:hypothetical protein [Desulfovibrio sp.]
MSTRTVQRTSKSTVRRLFDCIDLRSGLCPRRSLSPAPSGASPMAPATILAFAVMQTVCIGALRRTALDI